MGSAPDNKGFESGDDAEPCAEHGHELGVAESDAFSSSDEPVGEADGEDESGRGEDGQEVGQEGLAPRDRLAGSSAGPGAKEVEEKTEK